MPKKILHALTTLLLMAVIAAVFYIAVILGQPQEDQKAVEPRMDQPLLAASPAVSVTDEGMLWALRNAFPAPLLQPMPGSGLMFVSGVSQDAAFDGAFGRVATLSYRNQAGQELIFSSIYPARALPLLEKGDYVLADVAGQSLAGLKSVRMESETHLRLHAQAEEAIYVVTAPKMTSAELIAVTRSLQLYEGE